jgi:hypothetical protein
MTNEKNTAVANERRAQVQLVVVGRGGEIHVTAMRPDRISAKASNKHYVIEEQPDLQGLTLRQALYMKICQGIKYYSDAFNAIGKKVSIEVYTVGSIAIKYYQIASKIAGGAKLNPEDVASTNGKDTVADFEAYEMVADTILEAVEKGNTVRMIASGLADMLELAVPDGVRVYDGDKLNFVNGSTSNGITVRGWNTCNRQGATVVVRGSKNPRAYIYRAEDPTKPWKALAVLKKTIDGAWNTLPETAVDKSAEEGDEADLIG